MINMLPRKIRTKLTKEFGVRLLSFPPNTIINYLTDFDTKDNIMSAINTSRGNITKMIFNHPNGEEKITFITIIDKRKIINNVRSNGALNYHDYLTTFKFKTDHPIYDLIVEVNYRYVYS